MNEPEKNEGVTFSFDSSAEDFYEAACAVDRKNRSETRRNLESAALVIVFFMYLPPQNLLHWAMLALCVAIGLLLWKYPDYTNRKFAERKAAALPRFEMTVTDEKLEFHDGQSRETIRFEEGGAVYHYHGVLAVNWDKNRLVAIPLSRLDEETAGKLTALLKSGLGERYETVSDKRNAGGLFFRKKS